MHCKKRKYLESLQNTARYDRLWNKAMNLAPKDIYCVGYGAISSLCWFRWVMGVFKLCSNGITFGKGELVLYVASGGMQEEVSSNKKVSVKANRCLLRQAAKQNLCCLCNSLSAITAQFTLNRVIFLTFARFKTCSVWPSQYLQDLQKVSSEQFVLQQDASGLPHIVSFRTKSKDFFGTLCQNRHMYATELSFYLYDYTAPIFSVIQDLQNIFILFMFCKLCSAGIVS